MREQEQDQRVGVVQGSTVRVDGEGWWTVRQVDVDVCDDDVTVCVCVEHNSDSREVWVENCNGEGWVRHDTGEECTVEVC